MRQRAQPGRYFGLTLGSLSLLAVAAAAAAPTPAQIRQAIKTAESSKELWATVNICDTAKNPNKIGIRAEIPSLGFTTQMYMTFEVGYRSAPHKAFKLLRSSRHREYIGSASTKLLQGGRTYGFVPPEVLDGTVTFEWWYQGKLIGSTTRTTTRGHHADAADPQGYSAKMCRIRAG